MEGKFLSLIQIKNVSKTYGKKSQSFFFFFYVSFDIESGIGVAMVGSSGSG